MGQKKSVIPNLILHFLIGAGNRVRTGDLNLGKVALYQLSYSRVFCTIKNKVTKNGVP
jgi:hypothetical protein